MDIQVFQGLVEYAFIFFPFMQATVSSLVSS